MPPASTFDLCPSDLVRTIESPSEKMRTMQSATTAISKETKLNLDIQRQDRFTADKPLKGLIELEKFLAREGSEQFMLACEFAMEDRLPSNMWLEPKLQSGMR